MGGFLGSLGFAGIFNLLNTLFPVIAALVKVAEATNPQAGSGLAKFNQVVNQAQAVAMTLPPIVAAVQASGKEITDAAHAGDVAALSSGIGDMINLAVKVANATGAFQKSSVVQAITAAQAGQPNY